MFAPAFFHTAWAEAVGHSLQAGPSEHARAGKLPEYWEFYQAVRERCVDSWALGVRGLPGQSGGSLSYLRVAWDHGEVAESRLLAPGEPVEATYALAGSYADWKALCHGYDALRTVMYRKLTLEHGPLLEFFKTIYFFVESLSLISTVPTHFPESGAADVEPR